MYVGFSRDGFNFQRYKNKTGQSWELRTRLQFHGDNWGGVTRLLVVGHLWGRRHLGGPLSNDLPRRGPVRSPVRTAAFLPMSPALHAWNFQNVQVPFCLP